MLISVSLNIGRTRPSSQRNFWPRRRKRHWASGHSAPRRRPTKRGQEGQQTLKMHFKKIKSLCWKPLKHLTYQRQSKTYFLKLSPILCFCNCFERLCIFLCLWTLAGPDPPRRGTFSRGGGNGVEPQGIQRPVVAQHKRVQEGQQTLKLHFEKTKH